MIRDTLDVLAQYGLTYDENEKFLEMFSGKRYLSDLLISSQGRKANKA